MFVLVLFCSACATEVPSTGDLAPAAVAAVVAADCCVFVFVCLGFVLLCSACATEVPSTGDLAPAAVAAVVASDCCVFVFVCLGFVLLCSACATEVPSTGDLAPAAVAAVAAADCCVCVFVCFGFVLFCFACATEVPSTGDLAPAAVAAVAAAVCCVCVCVCVALKPFLGTSFHSCREKSGSMVYCYFCKKTFQKMVERKTMFSVFLRNRTSWMMQTRQWSRHLIPKGMKPTKMQRLLQSKLKKHA